MTTTINKNLALLLMGTVSTLIIYYFAQVKVTPGTIARPVTVEKFNKTLYRGISERHVYFSLAEQGIAKPFGGHSDPVKHRNGNNNSIFTSWTTDFHTAFKYATTDEFGYRCDGVILIKTGVPMDRITDVRNLYEGDTFREKEIMVKEVVRGCIVIPVKANNNWQKIYYKLLNKGH